MPSLQIRLNAFLLLILTTFWGCSVGRVPESELQVVSRVDIERYLGTWYEIARYPHHFEEGCYAAQAEYSIREDGAIRVINRCRLGGFQGELDEAEGRAQIVDTATNAKLEVQFFWPFWGDYWIIELDPDYQYAVVGHPSREYLWILSRSRKMDPQIFSKLVNRIVDQGYDASKLIVTPQPG